jgi:Cu(I)/Ag(I) efflux system membrane fusion protein
MMLIGVLVIGVTIGLSLGSRAEVTQRIRDVLDRSLGGGLIEFSVEASSRDTASPSASPAANDDRGRILYYRNPMGLPDTSPVPKKDSMGMDYIPVYENDVAETDGSIRVSPGKIQALGVTSTAVERRMLESGIKAFGTVVLDESRVWLITTKIAGWIETLHVSETGVEVEKGAALFELFSPQLYDLELEYVIAASAGSGTGSSLDPTMDRIKSAALQRLRNWGVPESELARLDAERVPSRTLQISAPARGRILERMGLPGMRIEAGEPIYRVADLSTVWVIAEVDEKDISAISSGLETKVEIPAFPGEAFTGTVKLIYPEIDPETRRVRVRIDIPNADERLRPGMLAEVNITALLTAAPAIVVPDSAVLDSGKRQIVLIDLGNGRYQPRPVQLGLSAGGFREVIDGVSVGERVVTSANFLLDSESNLQAALNALAAGATQP